MIGDLKLSDLIPKDQWEATPVSRRVGLCQAHKLEGKTASKAWGELTISEALSLTGKLPHWQDPIMSAEDYARARVNRESYTPKYPDGREETDESKERRRALDAEIRQRRKPVSVLKQTPVWDPAQMRMVYQ